MKSPKVRSIQSAAVIHGSILRAILDGARATPAEETTLLKRVGLSAAELRGEAATIPLSRYLAAFELLAASRKQPLLGLQIGDQSGPGLVGAIGYVFLGAPSLRLAIRLFVDGTFSIQGASYLRFEERPLPTLTYAFTDQSLGPWRQDVEFSLSYLNALIRCYLGQDYAPVEVYLEHQRAGSLSDYERVFRCPVYFDQERNALVLREAELSRSSDRQDARITSLLQHYLAMLAEQHLKPRTTSEQVSAALGGLLQTPDVTIARIAAALATSEHSLRRRLRSENTSFRALLRQKRVAVAKHHLRHSDVSLLQIAQRVGYADASAFTHAFIAETGMTPRDWRKSLPGSEIQGY